MDVKSVFPKLDDCPECRAKLKNIRYGMFATPPKNDEIDGGSLIDPNAPTKACPKCDWRGGNGGRTWETNFSRTLIEADPSNSSVEIERTINIDLSSLTNDELLEFGKYKLEARFELVFKGLDPIQVDLYYDQFDVNEAPSMPLIDTDVTLAYYNASTQRVEQVCYFFAKQYDHLFQYLRPGMRDWGAASSSVQEFHEVVLSMKKPDVSGWIIKFPDEISEEDMFSSPDNFGSEVIKAMIQGDAISREELERHATQLDETVYFPHWFEPAFYVSNWSN